MDQFELQARGPFSLAASRQFLEGFDPATLSGGDSEALRLAFVADTAFTPDGDQRAVAIAVRQEDDRLVCTVVGLEGEIELQTIQTQVERILSLDIDGTGFAAIGARDPVVGRLQARYPGLRPVLFVSPYEAAAWTLIGRRVRIAQAAKIKARLSRELGEAVEIDGVVRRAFPGPNRLASLEAFPGLADAKIDYLRALGERASSGFLDAAYLRSLPFDKAMTMLQEQLPGVGPFSAELILLRGAGVSDRLPVHEPRLGQAIALAYGLAQPPSTEKLATMGKAWRSYRTWVALLLRRFLEDESQGSPDQTGADEE